MELKEFRFCVFPPFTAKKALPLPLIMEKKTELQLLRPRSLASVITDGYRLYMGTFRTLFRSSWPVALVYALAFALFMGNLVNNFIPLQVTLLSTGTQIPPSAVASYFATMLFYLVGAALLSAHAVNLFREHSRTGEVSRPKHWWGRLCLNPFLRLLVVGVWMMLVGVVIDVVFAAAIFGILSLGVVGSIGKSIVSIVFLSILALIILALCIPLYYTVMRTLVADEKIQFTPPFRGYALGLRHWGLLFATFIVVLLFTSLLSLVCELPAVIMIMANILAYVGLAQGDPLGMPENMVPLTYAVFFVAGFIQAYVHLSALFPFYYAYGSIEEMRNMRDHDGMMPE